MAQDFIKIDRTTTTATHASLLLQFIASLRNAFEQGTKIKAIMDHNQDGTSFSGLEQLFGVPAGSGQTVYDLVNGSIGSFQGQFQNSDSKNLTERVG